MNAFRRVKMARKRFRHAHARALKWKQEEPDAAWRRVIEALDAPLSELDWLFES
jgi:ABC-type nitrate/sulfonate/bicarbonate transport system substrate-binding protein